MKAVMLSIQPKWCELIASEKKTVEVRKTKPKIDVPFKCYIYCTKDNSFAEKTLRGFDKNGKAIYYKANKGKVIGEFVCDEIDNFTRAFFDEQTARDTDEIAEFLGLTCLTYSELCSYVGLKDFYGWHITDLVIYDKPKELSEFVKPCNHYNDCCTCDRYDYMGHKCYNEITRPFQSWGYVKELKGETE